MRIRLHVQRSPFLRFAVHSHERFYIFWPKNGPFICLLCKVCSVMRRISTFWRISFREKMLFASNTHGKNMPDRIRISVARWKQLTQASAAKFARSIQNSRGWRAACTATNRTDIKNKNFSRIKYVFALFLELTAQTYTPANCEKEQTCYNCCNVTGWQAWCDFGTLWKQTNRT